MKLVVAIILAVLSATFACAQKISPEEQKLVAYIDAHSTEATTLLERTVNIESPTENLTGVKKVGAIFKTSFDSLGFTTRWINMPVGMKRAGHLLAEKKGTKGKRVLLLGHIDTVLHGEKFRRDGNKAFGTGSSDMKAGDVVLYFALKALRETGALNDASIIVLLTGDEEDSGDPVEVSRRDMIDAAKRSDLVLSFENGGSNIATVARRGSSDWTLEVTARSGHSSAIFKSMGSGAIFEAARILNQFYETLRGEEYLTFNPSVISGGTEVQINDRDLTTRGKTNVVPAKVVVRGDLRFIREEQKEAARAKMREIVAQSLPGAKATITFADGIPAMPPNEGNYNLLKELDAVSQDLGYEKMEALDPGARGAGDVAYVTHLLPGLDGLGATGGGAHAKGEYADLNTLPRQIKRAALLIYRLTR
ncbi:MAG TPA: M20/M25/M40 family metallo-hydrolase [Pyrinomonadaceae bacterium]|jgi:glutamate carboxypeptidase|nr:M20/M25/M40 family metallo-hydrolase [Pyrinomonadaceae bacterium]